MKNRLITLFILCSQLLFISPIAAQDLRFNEVMSSNQDFFKDFEGDTPDWFELYNSSDAPVNLSEYSVNDKLDAADAWAFPDYELGSKEYLLVFASGKNIQETPVYWQTIIDQGDEWAYRVPTAEPSSTWKNRTYDDSGWLKGPSGFGYGDNDDNTVLNGVASVFLRKSFTVDDITKVKNAILHIDYDDAFVAYLNGTEIARANITTDGAPAYNAAADNSLHEPLIYQGGVPEEFPVEDFGTLLVNGTNVLAIQVHNAAGYSSDLTAIPFFSVAFSTPVEPRVSELLDLPQVKFHTDFSIKSEGESLYLFRNNILADSVQVPALPSEISYGRDELNDLAWCFFNEPTPGKINNTKAYGALAGEVFFSVPGGTYNGDVQVELSTNDIDGQIYYTTDGTVPTTEANRYSGPILFDNTTVFRASVIKAESLPGRINTQSYFVNVSHDLPIISLVTDPANFFDAATGIYVTGSVQHPLSGKDCDNGQNFWQDWERPVHVSMINPDGTLAFEQNAGVKIFGGCSRTYAQKSLSLRFRKSYGKDGLDYKVFDNLDLDHFNSLNLRNSGNDWNNTMFRDALLSRLFPDRLDKLAYRPSVVYLNGEYWGIHNIRERIEDEYIEAHHGVDNTSVNMMEFHVNLKLHNVKGDGQHYLDLLNFIENNDLSDPENYNDVKTQMDVVNFALYQACNIAVKNTDWPGNNVKFWNSSEYDSKWRWILYDLDFGFSDLYHNTLTFALEPNGPYWPNPPESTYLLRQLNRNPEFKNLFINAFADVFNTLWRTETFYPVIDEMKNAIASEIQAHMTRWGGNYSNWNSTVLALYSYANQRPAIVRGYVQDYYELTGTYSLKLDVNNSDQGSIQLNTIKPEGYPWIGTYFRDVPVTLIAKPKKGYRFVRWEGASDSTNDSIVIIADVPSTVTAVFEKDDNYREIIYVNEVFYSDPEFDTPEDWVEIYNAGNTTVNLSGWKLKDDNDDHQFVIPEGVSVSPNDYLVVCRDAAAFKRDISS